MTQPTCPKCGRNRDGDQAACPRCGLVFDAWNAENASPLPTLDEQGQGLWQAARADWNNTALHEAFIRYCLQTNLLGPAGRLYREYLDQNPRDAVAAAMQKQVLSKATLSLEIQRSPIREPVTRNRWFWVILLSAMALGILVGLLWRNIR